MAENKSRPVAPVAPEGMEMIFFYKCPRCGRHVAVPSPIEPKIIACDACRMNFPIIPIDEHGLHFVRIMMAGGKAAVDPDFI